MKTVFSVAFKDVPGNYSYYSDEKISPGDLVSAPFRDKNKFGIAVEILEKDSENYSLKKAEKVFSRLVTQKQLILAAKISDYYYCTLGKALSLFLPPAFFQKIPKILKEETLFKNENFLDENLIASQKDLLRKVKDGENLRNFLQKENITRSRIINLAKKDALNIKKGKIISKLKINNEEIKNKKISINSEQNNALNEIFNEKQNKFLLFGITGSGKTEVYLQAAKKLREKGKTSIVLVPEISLTPSLISYFKKDFPSLSVIHSKLSDGARVQEYMRILENESDLILGSRLALFSPVKNLGLIVLDEEHEWTYKNDQNPRYDTRKCAEFLCEQSKAKLIFGSATPSIEAFYKAKKGEYKIIKLKKRAKKESKLIATKMPEVSIVDLKKERERKNFCLLSNILKKKIAKSIAKKKSVLLFLNRRGYFSTLVCNDCGEIAKCKNCDLSLVLHSPPRMKPKLLCHYCGHIENPILRCKKCNSREMRYFSAGTQNLYSEVKENFPRANIVRIDSDSVSRNEDFNKNIEKLRSGDADIFIGTQILAKGFDVSRISLVGVILADLGLSIPDFRSQERTFSLLTQVSGRTGRGSDLGEVFIQTFSPYSLAVKYAKKHDYEGFFEEEIISRKEEKFPPFSEIIKFIFVDNSKERAFLNAKGFNNEIKKYIKNNNILDVESYFAPALIPKKHNKFHFHVFIKGKEISKVIESIKIPTYTRIDRDPVFMT